MPMPLNPVPQPSQTQLSPLEEVLFKSWATANGIDNHNDSDNHFDHRAVYKQGNGMIHPPGVINDMASTHNASIDEAKAKADAEKAYHTEKMKAEDTSHQRELDIAKAHHSLKQLLIKRHLGI